MLHKWENIAPESPRFRCTECGIVAIKDATGAFIEDALRICIPRDLRFTRLLTITMEIEGRRAVQTTQIPWYPELKSDITCSGMDAECEWCGVVTDQVTVVEGLPRRMLAMLLGQSDKKEPEMPEHTEEQKAKLEQWTTQCQEWQRIKDEMLDAGLSPSAYQVTLEQRKRMLARGEKPVDFEKEGL